MRRSRLVFLCVATIAASACNAITGAGGLRVTGSSSSSGDASGGGTENSNSNGSSSHGTQGSGASDGSGGSAATMGPGGAGTGGDTSSTQGAGAAPPTCSPACAQNSACEASTLTCVCDPGFVTQGGACTPAPIGDPTTHTQTDVCTHWTEGHVVTDSHPLTASGAQCDAGTLSQGGVTDTLTRINMFRYLVGLGPVVDDPQYDIDAQACANLEAWWDFSSPDSPHSPPSTATCYTTDGASTAGESNIAWGPGSPAQSIDQYIQDQGNETTLGHRRWVVNPPLDPIGIGYWQTGGMYGNASCLRVFGSSGTGPNPPWNSIPPAGFTPIELTTYTWSFEGSLGGIATATATVLRVDDNTPLAVTMQTLSQGYGQDTVSWTPNGWTAEVGKTYRVTVTGLTGGDVVYDVKPVTCN